MPLAGKRALFISYNGMLDPLGQSQVIPYLRELAKLGVEFTLLSFERRVAFTPEGSEKCRQLKTQLAAFKIDWHWLRYHKRFSLIATGFDVLSGIRHATRLVKQKQIELIHARSHIPATIATSLKWRIPLKMIFDVRGLMADEYVDAGHWRKGDVPYRLTKLAERRAFSAADGVVTLTERIWPIIKLWDGLCDREVPHVVVPCCADLQMFSFDPEQRATRRAELGLGDKLTIVYCGSIDGWYLTDQMADFFAAVIHRRPDSHFLWLTTGSHDRIRGLMRDRNIDSADFTVRRVDINEVPSFLSAADAGLAFIKPSFSKLASSPTKFAEYLGCGLPLIINSGVGDADELINREGVGALVREFNEAEYSSALDVIENLNADPEQTRKRTRVVAERLFDVRRVGAERYADLYEQILSKN